MQDFGLKVFLRYLHATFRVSNFAMYLQVCAYKARAVSGLRLSRPDSECPVCELGQ
jgi:hypothetical protein